MRNRDETGIGRAFFVAFLNLVACATVAAPPEKVISPSNPGADSRIEPNAEEIDEAGPRIVALAPNIAERVVDNQGLQRFIITFDEAVEVPTSAVAAYGLDAGPIVIASQVFDPVQRTLTVDLTSGVRFDVVTLVLDHTIADAASNPLDGEVPLPTTPALPSGDGQAGGQAVFRFSALQGDADRNGIVDNADAQRLFAGFGSQTGEADFDPLADLNHDGWINVLDVAIWANGNGHSLPVTDGTSPVFGSITPDPASGVLHDIPSIQVSFSEPIDAARFFNEGTLHVIGQQAGFRSPSSAEVAPDGLSAVFHFDPPLAQCDLYTLKFSNAISDASGSLAVPPALSPRISGLIPSPTPSIEPHEPIIGSPSLAVTGFAPGAVSVEASGPGGFTTATVAMDGAFELSLALTPNRMHQVFVAPISACGTRGAPASVIVTVDSQAPSLVIDFPAAGAEIQAESTDVAGRVSDMLSGYAGLEVRVNGQLAEVDIGVGTNGTFFLPAVLLNTTGPTEISAVAHDFLGNEIVKSLTVRRAEIPPEAIRMSLMSGNGQRGVVGAQLSQPIVIKMTRPDDSPFPGKVITLVVTRSDGRLAPEAGMGPGSQMLQVTTDSQGLARAWWTLGGSAGCGTDRVSVSSRDIAGTIDLCASATPSPPDQINIGLGNNQRAETGAPVANPLSAWVSDGCNPAASIPVTFTVTRGGGKVNGQDSAIVLTTPTGHAFANLTLGAEPGVNEVVANFEGNPGSPATFVAVGVERDPEVPTSFSGLIFDNSSQPVGGADCTILLNGQFAGQTLSNEQGQFRFDNLSGGGDTDVFINGLKATLLGGQSIPQGTFPSLHYEVQTVPNAANSLPMPVLLPRLNPNNAKPYSLSEETVLTVEDVEGLKMVITPGSMRLGTGQPAPEGTIVALNQVHHDNVPMPMPDGASPLFAWTLQPAGAVFDPPIRIEYPNMSALPAGGIAYFLSFNHDTGRFEIICSGHVTADGSCIVSDPGDGLDIAGWGCNCPPYAVTATCYRCPDPIQFECSRIRFVGTPPNCIPVFENTSGACDDEETCTIGDHCEDGSCVGQRIVCGPGQVTWCVQHILLCRQVNQISQQIKTIAHQMGENGVYPLNGNVHEAFRHMWWQCTLERMFPGQGIARGIGDAHEASYCGGGERQGDTIRDLHNNVVGRSMAAAAGSSCFNLALDAALGHNTTYSPMLNTSPESLAGAQIPPCQQLIADDAGVVRSEALEISFGSEAVYVEPGEFLHLHAILRDAEGASEDVTATATILEIDSEICHFADGLLTGIATGVTLVFAVHDEPFAVGQVLVIVGGPSDTDSDGLPDAFEVQVGFDALDPLTGVADSDDDRLSNLREYQIGTDPTSADSDSDGSTDGQEVLDRLTDPLVAQPKTADFQLSVGGQLATPTAQGGFLIWNVVAADNFGSAGPGSAPDFEADDPQRAIGTAVVGGQTYYAFSDKFRLAQNGFTDIGDLFITTSPTLTPASLRATAPLIVLEPGQTTQLTVTATLGNGDLRDVTPRDECSVYRTSNINVATVGPEGLVTAREIGTAFITVHNEGVITVRRIDVVRDAVTTKVEGFVQALDGSPIAGAAVTTTSVFGGNGVTNAAGRFSFELVVPAGIQLSSFARIVMGGRVFVGISGPAPSITDGITDSGIFKLREVQPGPPFGVIQPSLGVGTAPVAIEAQDVEPDGDKDLITANRSSDNLSFLRNLGGGNFAAATTLVSGDGPFSVVAVNLDDDSDLDIAVCNVNSDNVTILRNDGATFVLARTIAVGDAPRSIVAADLDGDGDQDLATANDNSDNVSLLFNNGSLMFGPAMMLPAGDGPESIAAADLDGDLDQDLIVANTSADTVRVYLNEGLGVVYAGIEYSGVGNGPRSVAAGDLNGDGAADLAIVSTFDDRMTVLRNTGGGMFLQLTTRGTPEEPRHISLGDADGDGDCDALVVSPVVDAAAVFKNNGTGSFAAPVLFSAADGPETAVLADLTGEGSPDIALAAQVSNAAKVLRNDGSGKFGSERTYRISEQPAALAVEDLDNDGDRDVVVAVAGEGSARILLNDGTGVLTPLVPFMLAGEPSGVVAADFTNDGRRDIVTANGSAGTVSTVVQRELGGFESPVSSPSGVSPTALGAGDIDGDGKLDLVIADRGGGVVASMKGDGLGGFETGVSVFPLASPEALVVVDLNADLRPDIAAVSSSLDRLVVVLNSPMGFGPPVNYPTGDEPTGIAAGDVDGDGDIDLVVADRRGNTVTLMLNTAGAYPDRFSFAAGNEPTALALGDLDFDGDLDVIVAAGSSNAYRVLINSDGVLAAPISYEGGELAAAVVVSDLDGDADLDAIGLNSASGTMSVFSSKVLLSGAAGSRSEVFDEQAWPSQYALLGRLRAVHRGNKVPEGPQADMAVADEEGEGIMQARPPMAVAPRVIGIEVLAAPSSFKDVRASLSRLESGVASPREFFKEVARFVNGPIGDAKVDGEAVAFLDLADQRHNSLGGALVDHINEAGNQRTSLVAPGQPPKDLGTLGGEETRGLALNDRWQSVGWSTDVNGEARAFVLPASGLPRDLLQRLDVPGSAFDIDERGVIVGSLVRDGTARAFIWSRSTGALEFDSLGDGGENLNLAAALHIEQNGRVVAVQRMDSGSRLVRVTVDGVVAATDVNADHSLDIHDIRAFLSLVPEESSLGDINLDGSTDAADLAELLNVLKQEH